MLRNIGRISSKVWLKAGLFAFYATTVATKLPPLTPEEQKRKDELVIKVRDVSNNI